MITNDVLRHDVNGMGLPQSDPHCVHDPEPLI